MVGLLEDEPAGLIPTRNAGVAEFEATLTWPPDWETRAAVIPLLPVVEDSGIRRSLRESEERESTMVRGTFSGFDEDSLSESLDETLRALVAVAGVGEAALRTRVSRVRQAYRPDSAAIQQLARQMWGAGSRVRFGPSWSPAPDGVEVTLGCRGAREEISRSLGVDRTGVSG